MNLKICIAAAALLLIPISQASARPVTPAASIALDQEAAGVETVQHRGGRFAGRGGVSRPARPAYRPVRPTHRPAYRPGRPIYRPAIGHLHRHHRVRYWRPGIGWAVGGIVAIGALSAAAAAAYAPPPPAEGLCWYYTDATYRIGYWAGCR